MSHPPQPYGPHGPYRGYPHPGPPSHGPGGPAPFGKGGPPRKNAGLIIVVLFGALVLVGSVLGVVLWFGDGNAVPGAQKIGGVAGPGTATAGQVPPKPTIKQSPGESGGAEAEEVRDVATLAMRVLNTKDLTLARRLACDPASEKQEDLDKIPAGVSFALTGEPVIIGDHATVPYRATDTATGKTHDGTLTFRRIGPTWCGESST